VCERVGEGEMDYGNWEERSNNSCQETESGNKKEMEKKKGNKVFLCSVRIKAVQNISDERLGFIDMIWQQDTLAPDTSYLKNKNILTKVFFKEK
jgi:hypothetical protein